MAFMNVTILILIDGFLQYRKDKSDSIAVYGHNPYFNRWFSAILKKQTMTEYLACHNPYFNRWFSAMYRNDLNVLYNAEVTILILIDGFLQ